MNAKKNKKKLTSFFEENLIFRFSEKNIALNRFEFLEKFIIDNFFMQLTNLRKLDQQVKI